MNFESLANELFLDLFEYLTAIDLFHSFYNLNSRINTLLLCHFRVYHLDFKSISKYNFDIICKKQLPFILKQIISVRLSGDDETLTLPNIFLSYGFTFDQFIHLKSLTLNHIYSFDIVNQIIIQCQSLSYLSNLNLFKCCLKTKYQDISCILNNIWNISKLLNCNINNIFPESNCFSTIRNISKTIQNLSFDNIFCDLNDLTNLFNHTPNLQRFRTNISPSYHYQQLHTIVSSLISLKIFNVNSITSLMMIKQMPNLRYLTIKSTNIYLNGNEWKTIIKDYLPNIKLFQLKMEFNFPYQNDIKQQINQLIQTFQTSFWIKKKQWFIRCHLIIRNSLNIGILYTLPYIFDDLDFFNDQYSKSTCPNEEDYSSYDYIQNFHIRNFNNEYFLQSYIRLPNIRYLKSDFSYNDKFYPNILSLERLISLEIILPLKDFQYLQLEFLCKQSSCLYSLKFNGLIDFNNSCIISFLSKSISIRRLDFLGNINSFNNQCYNYEDCFIFVNSFLGKQCQVLLIEVENRKDIIYLINNMSNLRMLIFRCEYDRWIDTDFDRPLKNNELFIWFQTHLPSTCLILRDKNLASSFMHLWIGWLII